MSCATYYTDPLPTLPENYFQALAVEAVEIARHSETTDWWVVYRRGGVLEASALAHRPRPYVTGSLPAVAGPELGLYRHSRGALYRLEGVARSAAPLGWLAVYRSLEHDRINVRPLDLFLTPGRFTRLAPE